jgi:superfamily I DNA and/or RNA helicase
MNLVSELIQAIDEEIDALKNPKGNNRGINSVIVFSGRFLRKISGLNVYVFHIENFLVTLDDSPAEVEIDNRRISAQILLTHNLEVEIGLEQYLGDYIAKATLYTNSWYLWELLKKKLADNTNLRKADFEKSERIFLNSEILVNSTTEKEIKYTLGTESPNKAQKQAINASFSLPLSIIWGPPGTGKTRTIARVVESHLNAGRSVLLVSHANNAVDEALEDISGHLYTTQFYNDGRLIRLGKPQEKHLRIIEEKYPLVLPDKVAESQSQALMKEKTELQKGREEINMALSEIGEVNSNIASMQSLSVDLETIKVALKESEKRMAQAQFEIKNIEDSIEKTKSRLLKAQSSGAFKRLIKGLNSEKIQNELDYLFQRRNALSSVLVENTERTVEIRTQNEKKQSEVNILQSRIKLVLDKLRTNQVQIKEEYKRLSSRKDIVVARINEIDKSMEEIIKNILLNAKLIATTLTKTYTAKQLPNRKFDVLILDEASMAPLPQLFWAISLCTNFVTIVGDFLQLPPICVSEKPMAQKWLAKNIFSVFGIETINDARNNSVVTLLDTQYRMVPAISEISNRYIYLGNLKNDVSTESRKPFFDGISEKPLILVDTEKSNAWCSRLSTGGRFNLYQAILSVTLAKKVLEHEPERKIAIIVPYTHQFRLTNKIIDDWHLSESLRASTIYRFQGGEEQIVIFDTTEGIGLKTAPMLDDQQHDSDALKVINVAMTRAKDKLYLIANSSHLLNELSQNSLLSRVIVHFREKAHIVQSESLVDSYFTSHFDKWANDLLPSMTENNPVSGELFTEHNFWAQFINDIKLTKKRLIILSPFLSVNRSSKFMDLFKSMVSRNVNITVYSRPANQQTGEMAVQSEVVIDELRKIGIKVIERRSMHQKVAIIDDDIAWEGSLNILSHHDTGEQMRRFVGESTIAELKKNLELGKEDAVGNQSQEKCPGEDGKGCKHNGFLVIRQNKYRGNKFRGCSAYPRCKYTEPINRQYMRKERKY